ncbi:MAG: hypothetical protein QG562_621 [Patescibacteria group bacterium]|nr:hypothetical protein [Patescibacteria group bacterium]
MENDNLSTERTAFDNNVDSINSDLPKKNKYQQYVNYVLLFLGIITVVGFIIPSPQILMISIPILFILGVASLANAIIRPAVSNSTDDRKSRLLKVVFVAIGLFVAIIPPLVVAIIVIALIRCGHACEGRSASNPEGS